MGEEIKIDVDKNRRRNCPHSNYVECLNPRDETRYVCVDCGLVSKNKCEVWTRVVGYLRPIDSFNKGKKQEFDERVEFTPPK